MLKKLLLATSLTLTLNLSHADPSTEVTSEYTSDFGFITYAYGSSLFLATDGVLLTCGAEGYLEEKTKCSTPSAGLSFLNYSGDGINYAGYASKGFGKFRDNWFAYISQYPELGRIIVIINKKFNDIFSRLDTAARKRDALVKKFSSYKSEGIQYDKYLGEIDADIRLLSRHGMNLAESTEKLFDKIKPKIIDAEMRKDTLEGRKATMAGLRSFENELSSINQMPDVAADEAVDQIVKSIDKAVAELEKAVAQ